MNAAGPGEEVAGCVLNAVIVFRECMASEAGSRLGPSILLDVQESASGDTCYAIALRSTNPLVQALSSCKKMEKSQRLYYLRSAGPQSLLIIPCDFAWGVCVCFVEHTHEYAGPCSHRDQRKTQDISLCLSPYFLELSLSLNWKLTAMARLAAQQALGTSPPPSPKAGLTGTDSHGHLFVWVLHCKHSYR